MSNEQRNFLSLPRYPGLILLLEACWLLGLLEHQGKILIAKGHLVPAGKRRRPRKARLFISAYILELASDRDWLNKARDILVSHWEETNTLKRARPGEKSSTPPTA
ncbi:MAG TPA: hypothetical protein VFE51_17475 [Verrucomicrobiae bacterium]|nr:hypothetical protein [Verrucomicrobiae bacterium]